MPAENRSHEPGEMNLSRDRDLYFEDWEAQMLATLMFNAL